MPFARILGAMLALLTLAGSASPIECPDPKLAVDLPAEIRAWFRNPDGSCVQCSNGMTGVDQNVPAFATLLWDSEYGRKERGGSGPSRVANYARERNVRIYNITGDSTWDWMKWCCRNGRGAAIGAGGSHFQTLFGHDPDTDTWWVCNNNSTGKVDQYTWEQFRRLHLASGEWIVVLDYPPHPARAEYREWWK